MKSKPNLSTRPTSRTTPEKVWNAITTPEFTRQYWSNENVSDWKPGSKWDHESFDGSAATTGEVVESVPPKPPGDHVGPTRQAKPTSPNIRASRSRSKRLTTRCGSMLSMAISNPAPTWRKASRRLAARALRPQDLPRNHSQRRRTVAAKAGEQPPSRLSSAGKPKMGINRNIR